MVAVVLTLSLCGTARAAGGPYAVADAEISPPGECKIETWGSFANNADRIFVVTPSCTFSAVPWVELGVAGERAREEQSWETSLSPYLKANLIPVDRFGIGFGFTAGLGYNPSFESVDTVFAMVPATIEPVEGFRVNVNLGWERDRPADRDFATWGAGAEWLALRHVILLAEAFGRDEGRTGIQAGVRPTLFDGRVDLDFVFGRNITDARTSWYTVGATVRF